MRAMVISAIGGPEVLELREVPTPTPADDEVLVEVRTVAANRQDVFTMNGKANVRELRLPHIPGIDPAGLVAAVGSGVRDLAVGDRVLVKPAIACRTCAVCRAGQDDACLRLRNVGVHLPGGMAEYVAVPRRNVFRIPDGLEFGEATAIAHSFPVAMHLLNRAELRPDDIVLVTGAAGAIGSATVQLAKLRGATVVAAVGGRDRIAIARAAGADDVVDYGADPAFAARVRDAFPDGVSLYVEPAGNPVIWNEAVRTVGRRGRIAVCGSHAGPRVEVDLSWLFRNRVTIHGCSGSTLDTVNQTIQLAASGRIRATIDSRRPLAEARSAFERLLARENRGKVILEVSS
jgi:NADPH:quinone reductase-like Zn-dependent oxidoreductase